MLERESGSIINISSMSGLVANYPATGRLQRFESWSRHADTITSFRMGLQGVRVNSIAPGYMRTDLVDSVLEANPDMEETWIEYTPMGRLGRPEELGGLAVFLASEASSYMTGEVVSCDGGYAVR